MTGFDAINPPPILRKKRLSLINLRENKNNDENYTESILIIIRDKLERFRYKGRLSEDSKYSEVDEKDNKLETTPNNKSSDDPTDTTKNDVRIVTMNKNKEKVNKDYGKVEKSNEFPEKDKEKQDTYKEDKHESVLKRSDDSRAIDKLELNTTSLHDPTATTENDDKKYEEDDELESVLRIQHPQINLYQLKNVLMTKQSQQNMTLIMHLNQNSTRMMKTM